MDKTPWQNDRREWELANERSRDEEMFWLEREIAGEVESFTKDHSLSQYLESQDFKCKIEQASKLVKK